MVAREIAGAGPTRVGSWSRGDACERGGDYMCPSQPREPKLSGGDDSQGHEGSSSGTDRYGINHVCLRRTCMHVKDTPSE